MVGRCWVFVYAAWDSVDIRFSFETAPGQAEQMVVAWDLRTPCALSPEGEIRCWIDLPSGEYTHDSPEAVERLQVADGTFGQIAGQGGALVAVDATEGEVVVFEALDRPERTGVRGLSDLEASGGLFCGLSDAGAIQCGGACDLIPGLCSPPEGVFTDIAIWPHGCAVDPNGDITCWSEPDFMTDCGQVEPPAGRRFASVATGLTWSCATDVDGWAVCWGNPGVDFLAVVGRTRKQSFDDRYR